METVIWPKDKGTYKMIQLEVNYQSILRFGPNGGVGDDFLESRAGFHMDILESFLIENGFSDIQYDAAGYPVAHGKGYSLVGAGYAFIIPDDKEAYFYGESRGYKIPISPQHLNSMGSLVGGWQLNNYKPVVKLPD